MTDPIPEKIHDFNVFLVAPNYFSLRDFFFAKFRKIQESIVPGKVSYALYLLQIGYYKLYTIKFY